MLRRRPSVSSWARGVEDAGDRQHEQPVSEREDRGRELADRLLLEGDGALTLVDVDVDAKADVEEQELRERVERLERPPRLARVLLEEQRRDLAQVEGVHPQERPHREADPLVDAPQPQPVADVLLLVVALREADEVLLLASLDVLEQARVAEERRGLGEAHEVLVEGLDDDVDVLVGELVHRVEAMHVVVAELEEPFAHRELVGTQPDRVRKRIRVHAWPRDRHIQLLSSAPRPAR